MNASWTEQPAADPGLRRWRLGDASVVVAWARIEALAPAGDAAPTQGAPARASAAARTLLRALLAREFGLDAARATPTASANGRPTLAHAPELDVSIAHAGGWVVCAAGRGARVGVDVEPKRPAAELERIAERSFGPGTCHGADTGDGGFDLDAFFDRWTIAEALAKLEGSGLALVTPELRVDAASEPPRLVAWPAQVDAPCSPAQVALRRLELDDGCAAAIAFAARMVVPSASASASTGPRSAMVHDRPAAGPDTATIRAIVDSARQAPSGDNSQPFVYRWDGRTLHVELDGERADHPLDRAGHPSLLTLGMIRAALRQRAKAEGWRADATLGATERRAGSWLEVHFAPVAPTFDPLAEAMRARHTDRRSYRGGDLDAAPLRRIDAAIDAEGAGATVRVATARADHAGLRAWLEAGDRALWQAPAITVGAMRWVRFDEASLRREGDGVHWRNLGLPAPMAAGVALARAMPASLRAAALLGGPQLTASMLKRQLDSAAALVVIASLDPSREALVDAGAVAMRVWSSLCAQGWGCQPMSLSPLLALAARDGRIDPAIPPRLAVKAILAWPTIAASLGLPPGSWPAFVLRTGAATPLPMAERPPRRPLDALLRLG